MDIVIRAALPAEYAELGEITAQAYLGDGHLDLNDNDDYLNTLRDVAGRAARAEVLVAEQDGRVLGGVTFAAPGSPLADIAGADEAEFRMLAVARAGRGRGVGEALVRACLERARAIEGVTAMMLPPSPAWRGLSGSTRDWASCGLPSGTGSRSRAWNS